ncbi:MAG: hypothetical protein HY233_11115 [Acidobacteriales bacterium]|nr:hypothetical protein [Terriglobales bacterium]
MLFLQAGEVQVGENVAVKDQAAILILLQDAHGFASPAHVRAQVQVRQDQRVIDMRVHDLNCFEKLLRGDESENTEAARGNHPVTCL